MDDCQDPEVRGFPNSRGIKATVNTRLCMWSQNVHYLNDSLLSHSLWWAGQGAGWEGGTCAAAPFICVGSCSGKGFA